MSVDGDLYPYEVISLIDELETILNPKESPSDCYYCAITKRFADYLVIVCEDKITRQPMPFPEEFLQKWVYPQVPWNIHPDNYGLSPRSRKWSIVTVKFSLDSVAGGNSQHTTSSEQVEVHPK